VLIYLSGLSSADGSLWHNVSSRKALTHRDIVMCNTTVSERAELQYPTLRCNILSRPSAKPAGPFLPQASNMIMTRSPLRISLGGGGTDLPSYYKDHGGFVLAAAIDKYVYIAVHEPFADQIILKYSQMEVVKRRDEVQHPIVREALKLAGIDGRIEIASMSDIPAGTGLGSSGSFTTALLRALHELQNESAHPDVLAEQACHIEMDLLAEPVGKQDPYIAAFGGITAFTIHPDGQVDAARLKLSPETLSNLEDNLMLFFTGFTRSASGILRDQDLRSSGNDRAILDNLNFTKQLGYESKAALESGNLHEFARLMNVHWEHKKRRSPNMSNGAIDDYYCLALKFGALGGKLIGAGGGGFLMLYAEERTRLRRAMTEAGLREIRVRFDFDGTRVVARS
jgi:D-glycero-alpha-D-manno-heptose-7-phosphate kinase